jgi:hypothetical protein
MHSPEFIPENQRHEPPEVDPETACIECGDRGSLRCGCCGFPLCGMHHELGGGFCRSFTSVAGVPVCIYDHGVYVGVDPRDEAVVFRGSSDEYHLPDGEASDRPLCHDASGVRVTLAEAKDRNRELCDDCAAEARERESVDGGGC